MLSFMDLTQLIARQPPHCFHAKKQSKKERKKGQSAEYYTILVAICS